jgi:hypothetical protein
MAQNVWLWVRSLLFAEYPLFFSEADVLLLLVDRFLVERPWWNDLAMILCDHPDWRQDDDDDDDEVEIIDRMQGALGFPLRAYPPPSRDH